jgi:glutaredoxin
VSAQHQLPQTVGPIDRVPCPHCGKTNDFRELQGQQLMDTGSGVICDHCKRVMHIAAIRQVTLVAVHANQPANALQQAPVNRRLLKR